MNSSLEKLQSKHQPKYVNFADYNKLKMRHDKLKQKNEKLVEKNKQLQEMIDNMVTNYETIKESKKNTDQLINKFQEMLKMITNKPKEEYSTFQSQIEIRSTKVTFSSNVADAMAFNNYIMKKLEEMEVSYNEMSKNFMNTVKKYKILKEDNDNLNQDNTKLLQQLKLMNNELQILAMELNEKQLTLDRFKEIDRCLVDSTLNTIVLNTNEHRRSTSGKEDKGSNPNRNVPYITCEPIPSFLKFINKAY